MGIGQGLKAPPMCKKRPSRSAFYINCSTLLGAEACYLIRGQCRRAHGAYHVVAVDDLCVFAIHHGGVAFHETADFCNGTAVAALTALGDDDGLCFTKSNHRLKPAFADALGREVIHDGIGAA